MAQYEPTANFKAFSSRLSLGQVPSIGGHPYEIMQKPRVKKTHQVGTWWGAERERILIYKNKNKKTGVLLIQLGN